MLITNVSQLYNNLLISSLVVLVVTGVLDGLDRRPTNVYLRDLSLLMNSMTLYNVNTVNDG